MIKKRRKSSVWRILALGYLIITVVGSILLVLPFASADGKACNYLNALFTAVSATCVTGLAPYDTATHWTLFGQIVILLMIQIGGIGFMTFVAVIFRTFKQGLSPKIRNALMQSAGALSAYL